MGSAVRPTTRWCATAWLLATWCMAGSAQDPRDIRHGREIPSEGYCDQPYVVLLQDGTWLCTLTTGPGEEGDDRQHVVATRSADRGRTWSPLVDIEPHGPPEASWVMPLQVPSGRVYVFYVYNGDNLREVIAGSEYARRRVDTLGHYVFRYSDDGGRAWSDERYRVPIRTFAIDRENPYGGRVQFFWGVGKPIIHEGTAYIGMSKVGSFGEGFIERSEGFFLRSDNILSEREPRLIRWETLPEGDTGLRAPHGPIAEEHNLVSLSDGSLYCTYRTVDGHPCHAYSDDGGRSWSPPAYMTYTPGGAAVKHPRAANVVRRFSNGKYLYWFHNHGGRSYEDRNPAWLCGGIEQDGRIHWSQPEIALYDVDPKVRMSYPDFIEQDDRIFVTETQKTVARVHELPSELVQALWTQHEIADIAEKGLVLDLRGDALDPGRYAKAPPLPPLAPGAGFTFDVVLDLADEADDVLLLDGRHEEGSGWALWRMADGTMRLAVSDGTRRVSWDSDPAVTASPGRHALTIILDGGPRTVSFVANGRFCDGGDVRPRGWYRIDPELGDFRGTADLRMGGSAEVRLVALRVYDRYLLTSEAVGNWRAEAREKSRP